MPLGPEPQSPLPAEEWGTSMPCSARRLGNSQLSWTRILCTWGCDSVASSTRDMDSHRLMSAFTDHPRPLVVVVM